jgi:hypothetical protein
VGLAHKAGVKSRSMYHALTLPKISYIPNLKWTSWLGWQMSHITKNITVSFFSIEADQDFFRGFVSSFLASSAAANASRIFNLRAKKHLIKALKPIDLAPGSGFFITVVRERNTWQIRATRDGNLSGISSNQGIIGDPYFFMVVPEDKLVLGFTSGPHGSLRSVAKIMLEQFKSDRRSKIDLEFVPKTKDYSSLQSLPTSGEMYLKIDTSALTDAFDEAPQIIKDIGSSPFFDQHVQLIFNWQFEDSPQSKITKDGVIEVVNFFANQDGCLTLRIKGEDASGQPIRLDFGDAFFNYKTKISTRQTFIEEVASQRILEDALKRFRDSAVLDVE